MAEKDVPGRLKTPPSYSSRQGGVWAGCCFLRAHSMDWIVALALWGHIAAAAFWIGGMLFLSLVVVPLYRTHHDHDAALNWFRRVALRFRIRVWVAVGVLIATGLFLFGHHGLLTTPVQNWPTVAVVKVGLVAAVIIFAALHDFVVGPRSAAIQKKGSDAWTITERRIIQLSPWMARLTLLVSLVVLFVAVVLGKTLF